jgi:lipoyl(octanoyl) transferase
VGYLEAARLQHALVRERLAGRGSDTFLLLEHPPVITLGRLARAEHLLASPAALAAAGAEVWETSRGGDVTYHGPGQLVGYGILDLRAHGRDLGRYLRDLEQALIGVLADFGLAGERRSGLTGVWVGRRKVAAIGVRAERWVTAHGFALNVNPDLGHFGWIVPCGIRDLAVTSLAELLAERGAADRVPTLEQAAESARRHLGAVFHLELEPAGADALAALELPEAAPLGGIVRRWPAPPDGARPPDAEAGRAPRDEGTKETR